MIRLYHLIERLPGWTRVPFVPRPPVQATYNADGFATMHAADFLRDPAFIAAYQAGMATPHHFSRHTRLEWRVFVSCWAAKQGLLRPGAFVECGVNTGITALAVCKFLKFGSPSDPPFYLLDTFHGIPEKQLSSAERAHGTFLNQEVYYDCYEQVVDTFKPFPSVVIVRGEIPGTLDRIAADRISYLSVDLNNAFAEKQVLERLWDRLVTGAVVVLDDYGHRGHQEQRKIHDGFAQNKGLFVLPLPTGQGLLLKP